MGHKITLQQAFPLQAYYPTMCRLSIVSKSSYFIDLNEPHNAHSNQGI